LRIVLRLTILHVLARPRKERLGRSIAAVTHPDDVGSGEPWSTRGSAMGGAPAVCVAAVG